MTGGEWFWAAVVAIIAALVLVVIGSDHQWSDGTSLGVAGVALSVGGFGLAILQLQRTATKAEIALGTLNETLQGVAAARLGVVIAELRAISVEVEAAAERNDVEGTRAALNAWRSLSHDAQGLITRRFGAGHPSLKVLREATAESTTSKASLFDGSDTKVAVKGCLALMATTMDELGPLSEQLLPALPSALTK